VIRFIEYLYLLAAIGASAYLAAHFKHLPLSNKVFLAVVIILCAFMFSFRRRQRQALEKIDSRDSSAAEQEGGAEAEDTVK
jgi:uncharacterized membrane protein